MARHLSCLALDLGAESGRAILGRFDGASLDLREVHRFPNGPVRIRGGLFWDVPQLFAAILAGIARAAADGPLAGLAVDTWGVDFALLDRDGELLGLPRHYRDPRTAGMEALAFSRVPREEIFAATGIQFMPINSLYQLLALATARSPLLDAAASLLFMPDLFHAWLAGPAVSERTIASTSQLYDPRQGDWARGLLARLGVPDRFLPPLVAPGTVLGPLLPEVAEATGAGAAPVIAAAGHDTAAAVAAVPLAGADAAYLSSGTWSLMGIETAAPVITPRALAYNFTNETGVAGTVRLLKNIAGLWLLQQCRRVWGQPDYESLLHGAAQAPAFGPLVDPDAPEFLAVGDTPEQIRGFWARTGQRGEPAPAVFTRCILESLALAYRRTLRRLEELAGRPVRVLNVVGGGARNRMLCQWTADATGCAVHAGPVEATALGNVLAQLVALGEVADFREGRELVRRSFPVEIYEPRPDPRWEAAAVRFEGLIS
jgi:rhamnulokinase